MSAAQLSTCRTSPFPQRPLLQAHIKTQCPRGVFHRRRHLIRLGLPGGSELAATVHSDRLEQVGREALWNVEEHRRSGDGNAHFHGQCLVEGSHDVFHPLGHVPPAARGVRQARDLLRRRLERVWWKCKS